MAFAEAFLRTAMTSVVRTSSKSSVCSARCESLISSCQRHLSSRALVLRAGDRLRLGGGWGGLMLSIQLGMAADEEDDAELWVAGVGEPGRM